MPQKQHQRKPQDEKEKDQKKDRSKEGIGDKIDEELEEIEIDTSELDQEADELYKKYDPPPAE